MTLVKDILEALKSKRVILGVVTAAIIGVNTELNLMDDETLMKLTGVAAALIVGDSLRATNPQKESK
jgi:undecaprenyl pyrophosphate phosphatase UppP